MSQRIFTLLGCVLVGVSLALTLWLSPLQAQPAPSPKLDAALQAALARRGDSDEMIRVLVHLTTQPDLSIQSLPAARQARRAAVVDRLQSVAEHSQVAVRRQIERWQAAGQVSRYRPYWVFNGLWVEGTAAVMEQLAQRPDVAYLTADARRQLITDTLRLTESPPPGSWGLARIGALQAQAGLGSDGRGVTVATMDTGADWQHPALWPNYRGNDGGWITHAGNWYDAVSPTNTLPIDPYGHGTHVLGTAVGQLGLGVAPGARWISVRIFDADGYTTLSIVHAGFEWLLAPDGDPALAPDIVNGSWGSDPYSAEWLPDIAALRAADILPVFAAGNAGPFSLTVGAPAAYTDTLAVGASDDIDAPAWFSSVGPSVWTRQPRPTLVAPGTAIRSAFPGRRYAQASGTSMAAPHVSGAAALLLSVDQTLSAERLTHILTATAHPLDAALPSSAAGWGRLDAYAAVATQAVSGTLSGLVSDQGQPQAGVVVTITTPGGVALPFATDADGLYRAALRPGLYRLETAPFGFSPRTANAIVSAGLVTQQPLPLTPLPGGLLQGQVRELATGSPLSATLVVSGAPLSLRADAQGNYALSLPTGSYTIRAEYNGYRVAQAAVQIAPGQIISRDFELADAPSILLVDDGQWAYASQLAYYRQALAAGDYAFAEWSIRNPMTDIPGLDDLTGYDTVIWSSPDYAPGVVGAGVVISNYLGAGGNLLISGQDVGHYDGVGLGTQRWWYRLLQAMYAGETSALTVTGSAESPFTGLAFTLNGGSSANNQTSPDYVHPASGSLTRPIFTYDTGQTGALAAGQCAPYRIVYLGFGLEGVANAADRRDLVSRSLDYFASPRVPVGAQFTSPPIQRFAPPGSVLTYSLSLRNLSELVTDTLTLDVSGGAWDYQFLTPTLTLGPCARGSTLITVSVPSGLSPGSQEQVTVTATSAADPAFSATLRLQHQTPNHILLVADHRWYDPSPVYRGLLDELGLTYDFWEIGPHGEVLGSPSAEMLDWYDMVLWYTGYDWFAPIVSAERDALTTYLTHGGRLFLTSQDYLYYHQSDALTRDYLGVIGYHESVTPTRIFFVEDADLPGTLSVTAKLTYGLYQNFSDGLIPAPTAEVALWHNAGLPGAVANHSRNWRSLFWGLPFETVAPAIRLDAMQAIIGWLGDLGDSTFVADRRVLPVGATTWHTYTLNVRHLADAPTDTVSLTITLPPQLRVDSHALPPPATYVATNHQIRWSGSLGGGETFALRYRGQAVEAPPGSRLISRASLFYARHRLTYDRSVSVWVGAPDLSAAVLSVTPTVARPNSRLTLTLQLPNAAGLTPVTGVSATIYLPPEAHPLTDTLFSRSGAAVLTGTRILWQGELAPGETTAISLNLTVTRALAATRLPFLAVIADGQTEWLARPVIMPLELFHYFFPLVRQR